MPSHDFHDPLDVRRSGRIEDLGDFTEVPGAEQPGDHHAKLPRALRVEVREVMHMTARDEEDVAWSDTHLLAIGRTPARPKSAFTSAISAWDSRNVLSGLR